jgi:hypothetical protein
LRGLRVDGCASIIFKGHIGSGRGGEAFDEGLLIALDIPEEDHGRPVQAIEQVSALG